jgi:hypothetical protein
MNKEDRLYKLSQGSDTAVWAHDEIIKQDKRIAELEGVLRDITNEAKEVLTNARNTPAVRRQLEMSGSIKHYIVPRRSIISAENYLKEQGEWVK